MEAVLLVVAIGTIVLSALCTLTEAALFAVPLPYAKYLSQEGSKVGKVLLQLKEAVGQPIAALLIVSTVAGTLGATLTGALVEKLYGGGAVVPFSLLFTITILFFSEFIPKQIGIFYSKRVAVVIAFPLNLLVKLLYPLVRLSEKVSDYMESKVPSETVSQEEVLSLAEIGGEEGVIDHFEGSVIRNVIGLDRLQVKDILTPRVVVYRLPEDTILSDIKEDILALAHTRVPLYRETEPDSVMRYVTQRDLFRALLKGHTGKTLLEFSRPLTIVTEYMRADKLLLQMFELGEAICSVVDEHGGFAGIVTLEDVIEEIVGREIVDEYDMVKDLRSYAKTLQKTRRRSERHPSEGGKSKR